MLHGFPPLLPSPYPLQQLTWPQAMDEGAMIGVVVCKLETHRGGPMRGYIAMLAVKEHYRGKGIATNLVKMAIKAMIERGADEVLFMLTEGGHWANEVGEVGGFRDRNHQYRCHETLRRAGIFAE